MIYLDRFKTDYQGTFGHLYNESELLCFTCELPWKDNAPEVSCIPTGAYDVQNYSSPLHPNVWQVMNVPGRVAILVHQGNTILDVRGCICVGDMMGIVKGLPAVLHSQQTFSMLKHNLPDRWQLTIRQQY